MSSLGLTQDELKAVEQTRQRLSQLSNTINSLKNDVFTSHPLPSLESLQSSTDILERNISAILEIMSNQNQLFSRIAIHPSTNFPGRTQENILSQLLRKKPEPDVEAAMDEGRKTLLALKQQHGGPNATGQEDELDRIWELTRDACQEGVVEYVQNSGDPFTAEEHEMGTENVRTGLRRSLFDDEDEDEEDEEEDEEGQDGDDDVMIIDRPPPPPTTIPVATTTTTQEAHGASLENVMRFASRGQFGG